MTNHSEVSVQENELDGTWTGKCFCRTEITTRTEAHTRQELTKHIKKKHRREQLEDALELVEAIIARDEACWALNHRVVTNFNFHELSQAMLAADEHAEHLMQIFRARYGNTR